MHINNEVRFVSRVLFFVGAILAVKLVAHLASYEPISLNALFSGMIAGNVFLMGFLLSGVLADYKESERLPGELSACLENMAQEVRGIAVTKPEAKVGPCLSRISQVADAIHDWFYKKIDTEAMLGGINSLTDEFEGLQQWTQGTFVARLKQEQSNLRRTMTRIDIIRETNFVTSGYLLAYLITGLLCIGLVLLNMEPRPFEESMFFTGVIAFLLVFLITLIRDLDNPFGYYERYSGADVSLKPLEDTQRRLAAMVGDSEA
jgi:hypothetical protein